MSSSVVLDKKLAEMNEFNSHDRIVEESTKKTIKYETKKSEN